MSAWWTIPRFHVVAPSLTAADLFEFQVRRIIDRTAQEWGLRQEPAGARSSALLAACTHSSGSGRFRNWPSPSERDPIAHAKRVISADPDAPTSATLRRLMQALVSEGSFELGELYALSSFDFELAMQVLASWRLQRYCRKGAADALSVAGQ